MGKTKSYIEWQTKVREQKWTIAKSMIKVCIFILDLCI